MSKNKKKGGHGNAKVGGGRGGGGVQKKQKVKHKWRETRDKKKKMKSEPGIQVGKKVTPKDSGEKASLRSRMMERLSVARFRMINEAMDSQLAPKSVKTEDNPLSNKSTFEAYHKGLTSTSSSWKVNPLDNIIKWVKKKVPAGSIIADFGCGDARLAKEVEEDKKCKETLTVYSFDLCALNERVTECDVGKEGGVPLEDESVDVVVCCLSLMGRDVSGLVTEAARVLKIGGRLKIGEVRARLFGSSGGGGGKKGKDESGIFRKFLNAMRDHGFLRAGKDEIVGGGDVFVILEFKKVGERVVEEGERKRKKRKVMLEPVTYKKR